MSLISCTFNIGGFLVQRSANGRVTCAQRALCSFCIGNVSSVSIVAKRCTANRGVALEHDPLIFSFFSKPFSALDIGFFCLRLADPQDLLVFCAFPETIEAFMTSFIWGFLITDDGDGSLHESIFLEPPYIGDCCNQFTSFCPSPSRSKLHYNTRRHPGIMPKKKWLAMAYYYYLDVMGLVWLEILRNTAKIGSAFI